MAPHSAPANQNAAIKADRAPRPPQPDDPLEQRILDLIQPFRDSSAGNYTMKEECKALILCENIAFLIRHRHSGAVRNEEVSIAVRHWSAHMNGTGAAGLGIFVHPVNAYTYAIVRVPVHPGESVVEKLTKATDEELQQFFPDV